MIFVTATRNACQRVSARVTLCQAVGHQFGTSLAARGELGYGVLEGAFCLVRLLG